MAAPSPTDFANPKRLSQRELIAELQKLYNGKGLQRDLFGRRTALPSEVAAWVANTRRRCASEQG